LDGRQDLARAACLELAAREPTFARDALLLAAAHAEEQGDAASAVSDLERVKAGSALSPDEARDVDRRLRRLRPFAVFEEALRVDRSHQARLPFVVHKPFLASRSARG